MAAAQCVNATTAIPPNNLSSPSADLNPNNLIGAAKEHHPRDTRVDWRLWLSSDCMPRKFSPLVRNTAQSLAASVVEIISAVVLTYLLSILVEGVVVAVIINFALRESRNDAGNESIPSFENSTNNTCFTLLYEPYPFQIPVFNVVLALTLLIYVLWILYRMNQYNLRLQYVRTTKVIQEWDDTSSESDQERQPLAHRRSPTSMSRYSRSNNRFSRRLEDLSSRRMDPINVEDLHGKLKSESNWAKRRCLYFKHLAFGYMLPLYFSLVHWFTLVDFLVLVWMLIAAAPDKPWFRITGVLLRACYRVLQFVALVVLFMPMRRAKSNPGIVTFDWRRALLLACPIAMIPTVAQLVLIGITEPQTDWPNFFPQVDVALCTPDANNRRNVQPFWDENVNTMSVTFWIARGMAGGKI